MTTPRTIMPKPWYQQRAQITTSLISSIPVLTWIRSPEHPCPKHDHVHSIHAQIMTTFTPGAGVTKVFMPPHTWGWLESGFESIKPSIPARTGFESLGGQSIHRSWGPIVNCTVTRASAPKRSRLRGLMVENSSRAAAWRRRGQTQAGSRSRPPVVAQENSEENKNSSFSMSFRS